MADAALSRGIVYGIKRCSQCGVATPLLSLIGKPTRHVQRGYDTYWYFTTECSRCRHHILFYGLNSGDENSDIDVVSHFPPLKTADESLPPKALKFLQQAFESKHAPDGALMLSASAIDAMLKEKGYNNDTLYKRIKAATESGLLTKDMSDWAHEIRLSANEPRHADDDFDGATPKDAEQILEFAVALGEYLFILPERVKKWKEKAQEQQLA